MKQRKVVIDRKLQTKTCLEKKTLCKDKTSKNLPKNEALRKNTTSCKNTTPTSSHYNYTSKRNTSSCKNKAYDQCKMKFSMEQMWNKHNDME